MILKVCRRKFINNDKVGSIETVTEFYNGNSFKEANGIITIDDKETVIITDYEQLDEITENSIKDDKEAVITTNYEQLDEITGNFIKYETVYAFIMNNEGKTIERLI